MLNKFLETIEKHRMIEKGDGIVIGVSGGPDSISLLHLLWRIQKDFDLKLHAVHLNHQFRGKEADEDAAYVDSFCNKLQIPSFIYTEDVSAYAVKNGMTDEEAGRELRYKWFYEVLKNNRAQKIAVAQNMNDQAETVLMRLMRGSGIEGLSAIEYKRNNTIIRPLLDIERKEIEDYCQRYQLMPRIDKTNLQAVYTRNRIRLELIPYMEENFNSNIKATLCRTANLLREDSDFINRMTNVQYNKAVKKSNDEIRIFKEILLEQHHAIKKRILRKGIKDISGELKDVESKHIEMLIDLLHHGRVGAEMNLPKGITAVLDYNALILRSDDSRQIMNNFEYNVIIGENIHVKELNGNLSAKILNISQIPDFKGGKNKVYFDFDKVQKGIKIRNRRKGDRFTPLGMSGRKKLKDFFIDEKVPREERDKIPLICDGDEIMWIIGYRVSNKYKINNETKTVIEIEFQYMQ